MTSIKKSVTALVVMAGLAGMLAVSALAVHNAFADDTKTITKTTTNTGVNVPTDTDQKQQCDTAGGMSGISGSCTAKSNDTISQSGGVLHKK